MHVGFAIVSHMPGSMSRALNITSGELHALKATQPPTFFFFMFALLTSYHDGVTLRTYHIHPS